MFIIGFKDNSISWYPNTCNIDTVSWNEHFVDLCQQLSKQIDIKEFDINTPILFDANHENNKNLICNKSNSIVKHCNILNSHTIECYWNLLCDSRDISVINFVIGINGISGKKAIIISHQSLNGVNKCLVNYFVFDFCKSSMMKIDNDRKEDDSGGAESDWNGYFEQLVSFLNPITNNDNNNNQDLSYSIHAINKQQVVNISSMVKITQLKSLLLDDTGRMNLEVKNGDDFEKCFVPGDNDSNSSSNAENECYLLVENKHYFILQMNDIEYEWHPQIPHENNWENEYNNLLTFVCDKFGLINDKNLHLKFVDNDDESEILNSEDIEMIWDEIVNDNERHVCISVSGLPLVSSPPIAPILASEILDGAEKSSEVKTNCVASDFDVEEMISSFLQRVTTGIKNENFIEIEEAQYRLKSAIGDRYNDISARAGYKNCQSQFCGNVKNKITDLNWQIGDLRKTNWRDGIKIGEIKNLANSFGTIARIISIGEILATPQQNKDLMRVYNKSQRLLSGWVDGLLSSLSELIECNEFVEAESAINYVLDVWSIISDCTPKEYEQEIESKKIVEHSTWDNRIRDRCNKSIEEYSGLTLDNNGYLDDHYSLKNLSEQLKTVPKHRRCYRVLSNETWKDFQKKFDGALNDAQKAQCARKQKKLLSLCGDAIVFAPNDKQDRLRESLEDCKRGITQRDKFFDEKLAKFENKKDFGGLVRLLRQAESNGEKLMCSKILTVVKREISHKWDENERNLLLIDSNDLKEDYEMTKKIANNHKYMVDIVRQFKRESEASEIWDDIMDIVKCAESTINKTYSFDKHLAKDSIVVVWDILETVWKVLSIDASKNKIKIKLDQLAESVREDLAVLEKGIAQNLDSRPINFKFIESTLMDMEFWGNDKRFNPNGNNNMFGACVANVEQRLCNLSRSILQTQFFSNNKRIHKERTDLIESIKTELNQLINCHTNFNDCLCKKYLKISIEKTYLIPIFNAFCLHMSTACEDIQQNTTKQQQWNEDVLDLINDRRDILDLFKQHLLSCVYHHASSKANSIVTGINRCDESILAAITDKYQVFMTATDTQTPISKFATYLLELEMASQLLTKVKCFNQINQFVSNCLTQYAKTRPKYVAQLGVEIENEWKPEWSGPFLSKHHIFAAQSIVRFSKATNAQGIEYIEENIKYDEFNGFKTNTIQLSTLFKRFDAKYTELIEKHLKSSMNIMPIVQNCEQSAQPLRKQVKRRTLSEKIKPANWFNGTLTATKSYKWDSKQKERAIDLIAHVFAIWTLLNSKHYFDAKSNDTDDRNSYLMQPRAAQVVSIFRLLSIDNKDDDQFVRHLVEIGTGEGKSLTLAVASCIWALMGFDVSCVCYSKYLSQRDFNSFENLFALLRVKKYIHYGTFDQLCERTINAHGNIRTLVENAILPQREDGKENGEDKKDDDDSDKRWKILLIDEVDVFFSDNFYGKEYTPAAMLRHCAISNLTDFIWKCFQNGHFQDKKRIPYQRVVTSQQFKNLKTLFGSAWKLVLVESLKQMLFDMSSFKTQKYEVYNDKIGYRRLDGLDYDSLIGYKTMWAYYHEYHVNGSISKDVLDKNKYICLSCGMFSYAEIAKDNFDIIMGVSGTLKTLLPCQREIMINRYGIKRFTYMPSLFGKSKFYFDKTKDIIVCEMSNYYENLKEEINTKMNDHSGGKRCVFVFFDSKQKLDDFYECKQFVALREELNHQDKLFILSEELDENEKRICVARSCTSGSLLLSTKSFGRGTDFQIADKIVKNNGGPHVIASFLSVEISEEKQIMGRTARQGGEGSFSMVLNENDLKMFQIDKKELNDIVNNRRSELYQWLELKRKLKLAQQVDDLNGCVKNAANSHKNALRLLNYIALHNNAQINPQSLVSFLTPFNQGPKINFDETKVAVLVDATTSMRELLNKSKNTIEEMFKRISAILVENSIDPKPFQLQFIAYRNYNAPSDLLLQHSSWCCDSKELKRFLDGVPLSYGFPGAGMENEAIEVAFEYVNSLMYQKNEKIDQIIVIGDAPPNTKDDVTKKRAHRGEVYWKNTKYKKSTYWEDELKSIAARNVKVNAFYLKDRAKNTFATIAQRTGGKCNKLDIESDESAETLTNLVSQRVLDAAGGDKLVEEYQAKYMHA